MLDLKRLTYLTALYHHRSYTKASEELFVTQPAISLAVKALERQTDIQLLDRQANGVVFTPEGEQYVLHAQHILQECEKTETILQELSTQWQQTLHLGISPTLGMNLQRYICSPEFRQRFPLMRLSVEEDAMNVQIERSGEAPSSSPSTPCPNRTPLTTWCSCPSHRHRWSASCGQIIPWPTRQRSRWRI